MQNIIESEKGVFMRVSQISVYKSQPKYIKTKKQITNYQPLCKPEPQTNGLGFRGKFGAIVGGVFGAAAVIATAIAAAPVAACLAGGGAIIGAIGGDVAEDAINNDGNNEKE